MFCDHVYRQVKNNPCELCGKDSHIIDWQLLKKQRDQHREDKGLFYNVREWWSI